MMKRMILLIWFLLMVVCSHGWTPKPTTIPTKWISKANAIICGATIFFSSPLALLATDVDESAQIIRDAQAYDLELQKTGVSATVPTRPTIIAAPELNTPPTTINPESLEGVLNLIPSYKYFKIISKEYSSRSTNYVEGKENLLSPFQ